MLEFSKTPSIGLNDEQNKAALAKSNVMLLAGAGSGKTRVIVSRVNYLMEDGISPTHILCLTFTNKAAKEMRERIGNSGVRVCTFHAWAVVFLRYVIRKKKAWAGRRVGFTIFDTQDQLGIIKGIMSEEQFSRTDYSADFNPKEFMIELSKEKDSSLTPVIFDKFCYDSWQYAEKRYSEIMISSNAFDYSDLIRESILAFKEFDDVSPHYKHLMIDEWQDTNSNQYHLIEEIYRASKSSVMAVGDIDQLIYGWRGSDPKNIEMFINDYDAELLFLKKNYRSTETIVMAANSLIKVNKERVDKEMVPVNELGDKIEISIVDDQKAEAKLVSRICQRELKLGHEVAILYRTNRQSGIIEKQLVRDGVSHKMVKDVSFIKRREIKSVVSLLKMIINQGDVAAVAVVAPLFIKGLGKKTLAKLLLYIEDNSVLGAPKKKVAEFNALATKVRELGRLSIPKLIEELGSDTWFPKLSVFSGDIGSDKDMLSQRSENIIELFGWLSTYKTVLEFVTSITLDLSSEGSDASRVSLMTMHASKGLEFDVVVVAGCSEAIIPSISIGADLEEQRRLLYVSMTRAKTRLYMISPKSIYGGSIKTDPCPFIYDLPKKLVKAIDRMST